MHNQAVVYLDSAQKYSGYCTAFTGVDYTGCGCSIAPTGGVSGSICTLYCGGLLNDHEMRFTAQAIP